LTGDKRIPYDIFMVGTATNRAIQNNKGGEKTKKKAAKVPK
jgi:hypothetical protein